MSQAITSQEFALIAKSQLAAGIKSTLVAHAAVVAALATMPHDDRARRQAAQSVYADYITSKSGISQKVSVAMAVLAHMGEATIGRLLQDVPATIENPQDAALSIVQAITQHILSLGKTEDDVRVALGLKAAKAVKVESETERAQQEADRAAAKLDLLRQVEAARIAAEATDATDADRHNLTVAEARFAAEFGGREAKEAAKAFLAAEAARATLTESAQAMVADQIAAAEAAKAQAEASQSRLAAELASVKAEAMRNGAELVAKIAELEKRAESAEAALQQMAARAEKAEQDLAILQAVARQAAADAAAMVKPAKRAARNVA